jgi:hypothetical protein
MKKTDFCDLASVVSYNYTNFSDRPDDAARTSETSVYFYKNKRHHIPER